MAPIQMPEKAQKLLKIIEDYAKLEISNTVILPADEILKAGIEHDEITLVCDFLSEKNLISGYTVRERSEELLSKELAKIDDTLKQRFYIEGIFDFNLVHFALYIFNLIPRNAEHGVKIKFLDKEATLEINGERVELPPSKNEYYFCRAMFKQPINVFVDWSVLYEEITGSDGLGDKANWRKVYDTFRSVNRRIADKGVEPLFAWTGKGAKRRY